MKVRIRHSESVDMDRINKYAKELLNRTLDSYRSRIHSVTVEVGLSTSIQLGEFDYHCLVQILMRKGNDMKVEARDCDEILAIYHAVDKARNMMEHQEDK